MAILSKAKSVLKRGVSNLRGNLGVIGDRLKTSVTKALRNNTATASMPKINTASVLKKADSGSGFSLGTSIKTTTGGVTTPSGQPKSYTANTSSGRKVAGANISPETNYSALSTSPYASKKSSSSSAPSSSTLNSLSRLGAYVATTPIYSSTKSSSTIASSPTTSGSSLGSVGGSMAGELPQAPSPTNFTGLTNNYSTLTGVTNIDGTQKDITGTAEATPPDMQSKAFVDVMKELQPKEPERLDREQIMKEAGLTQALKDQQKLANQISAITAQKEAQLLQLRGVAGVEGVTEAVYGGQQAQIEREAAIKLLPLTAQYEAASNNVQAAKELVANFIADENNYQTRLYQYQNNLYNKIWDYATDQQKTALDEKRRKEDRQYQEEKDFRNEQYKLAEIDLDTTGGKNLGSIFGSQNYDELEGVYSRVKPSNNITITEAQASDPFIKKLAETSGGKPLTDTSIQKIDKALTTLGQIGVLQSNIQNMKTGPILGSFRGANPWDTNAQVIKAQLNAIVPNLARGVYGEVGVLTDNDIKNYSKTLPTLSSTEDVRNLVLGITVDQIAKSLKNTLEVNAANGKDVSGFIDLYQEMVSTRDSIFSKIGDGVKASPEEEQIFKDVLGQSAGFDLDSWTK